MTNLPEEIKKQIEEKYPIYSDDWEHEITAKTLLREAAQWGYGLRGKEDISKIICPVCGKGISLTVENRQLVVEGHKVTVPCFGYTCTVCNEDYNTDATTEVNLLLAKHLKSNICNG